MMLRSGAIDTKEMREIRCPHMGNVNVYVQGQRFTKETVVLNVHDLGYNHLHYVDFLNEPAMSRIAQKSVWVFVILPGQISNCVNLPDGYTFPTLQEIAEDLVTILNELHVKEVVLFGDRAGANILMRFALVNPNRVLGAFLINATAASNNILDSIQDKFRSWIISDDDKTSADDYLVYHRFGAIMKYHHSNATRMIVERYRDFVHRNLNIHNVKLYIDAFNKRTAITDIASLRCSAVFMTSERSVFRKTTRLIHQALLKVNYAKTKVEFVDVSEVGNVMEETPEKVIESLQYFLQGLGIVASAPLPNLNLNPAGKQQIKSRSVSVSAMTSSQSLDKPVQTRPRNVSVVEYSESTGKAADGRAHAHARRSGPPGSPLYVAGQPIWRGSDEELAMKRGSNPTLHKIKEEDEEFKPNKNWVTFTSPETGANKAAVNGNSEP